MLSASGVEANEQDTIFAEASRELRGTCFIIGLMNDEQYMALAIQEAKRAAELGEVPIGAVVVASRPQITPYSRVPAEEQERLLKGYLRLAAEQGYEPGSEPDQLIVCRDFNRRELNADPAGHGEFLALRRASEILGAWRLSNCTVYVTLEPCLMCAGLMYQARIARCVFGAYDPKGGALGSLYQVHADERLNHTFSVEGGVLGEECAKMMKDFFAARRKRNKELKRQSARCASAGEPSE